MKISFGLFLNIAKAALVILPYIPDIISALEKSFPGSNKGERKRDLAKELITDLLETYDSGMTIGEIWPIIEKWIGRFVSRFNEDGWPEDDSKEVDGQ